MLFTTSAKLATPTPTRQLPELIHPPTKFVTVTSTRQEATFARLRRLPSINLPRQLIDMLFFPHKQNLTQLTSRFNSSIIILAPFPRTPPPSHTSISRRSHSRVSSQRAL